MTKLNKFKICIVSSNYNNKITSKIINSAQIELKKKGFKEINIIYVSGSFEIPVMISKMINKYHGFIAVGCIIKGKTNNFDLISKAITDGIMKLSIESKKPIGNSVITAFNKSQCFKRVNRGAEAALAVASVLKNDSQN